MSSNQRNLNTTKPQPELPEFRNKLFLTELYPPVIGGSSRMFESRFRQFPGDKVTVLTNQIENAAGFDSKQGYAVVRTQLKRKGPKGFEWTGVVWQLILRAFPIVFQRKIKVIECARPIPEGVAGWLLSTLLGRRLVVNYHGEDISVLRRYKVEGLLMGLIARRADLNLANSSYTASLIRAVGGPKAKVAIVPPGFNPSLLSSGQEGHNDLKAAFGDGPILLTVGRLQRRKGQDMVIRALSKVVEKFPSVRYVIVGSMQGGTDGLKESLEIEAKEAGVEKNVVFVGEVEAERLPHFFQVCDVFVMPNREESGGDVEGFGIVFLEAGYMEKPVIGGNSGGVPDAILDGETGLLVDGHSPDSVAAAILRLLEDPQSRTRMGQRGRQLAMSLSENKVFERYASILREKGL